MVSWLSRVLSAVLLALAPRLDYLHLSETPNSLRTRVYFTSCLILEISVSLVHFEDRSSSISQIFISSWFVLQLQQPPAIRLLDSTTVVSRAGTPISPSLTPPPVAENDLLASLTLSSKPVVAKPPIFGVPSRIEPPQSQIQPQQPDADAMDWTPTSGGPKPQQPQPQPESFWLRPQRFFAPENPTGLEGLLERTGLGDDVTMRDANPSQGLRAVPQWWWLGVLSILPVAALLIFQHWHRASSAPVPVPLYDAPEIHPVES